MNTLYKILGGLIFAAILLVLGYQAFYAIALAKQWEFAYPLPSLSFLPMFGLLLFILPIYFLPALVAVGRSHAWIVALLNLLFGWTGVVWIIALLVAIRSPKA